MKSFLLSPISILLSLLICITASSQTFFYFQDSPQDDYYDFSWLVLETPSYLELAGYDDRRFPVETETPAKQGLNSLRLHWKSVPGGYWHAIAAGMNWTEKDISGTDTLIFFLYSPDGLSKDLLPKVFMEDTDNDMTPHFPIDTYTPDLPAGIWTRIAVPMEIFFNAGGAVNFTRIKTIGWSQNAEDNTEHILFIDDVRVQTGDGSSPPVATPTGLIVKGYDGHVWLTWDPNTENNLSGYEIYRSADGGDTFQRVGVTGKTTNFFSDFVRSLGTNLSLQYRITALNDINEPSPPTEDMEVNTFDMTDEQLMEMVQEATFRYFWDFAHPVSGLTRERNTSGDVVTIGGSGFGVMAILVGIERGFITREQGVEQMRKIVQFLKNADRFHGAWPHWMNGNTGEVIPFSTKDDGGDLVETAFMFQGLLTALQYFDQNGPEEQAIRDTITELWKTMEWDWYRRNNSSVLYWHWSPNYGWAMNMQVRGYNEAMIVYILAVASPTHGVPASLWKTGWAGSSYYVNGKTFYGYKLDVGWDYGGPLFFAHYSFLGFDPRNIKDDYTNYFNNCKSMSLIHRAYCIDNPKNHPGYGANCWGLTASDDPNGYAVHEPTSSRDNGTITPSAALSSMPYTPDESMDVLRHLYRDRGDKVWGHYGFYDAFNLKLNWYASSYLAIDQGPIIAMIENHRSGLLWDKFMSNPEIGPALEAIGFIQDPFATEDLPASDAGGPVHCYPNPASSEIRIRFELETKSNIQLEVFNMLGKLISTPVLNQHYPAGEQLIPISLVNLPDGIYFIRLKVDQQPGTYIKVLKK